MLRLFLFTISFTFVTTAFSQVAFYNYGIQNGLPEARIVSISQDSTGFIWLAGENTLFRFDGNQFLAYGSSNYNSQSVPFIKINTLFTDEQGTLWVGAHNGIAYYDFFRDEFIKPVDGWNNIRTTNFCQVSIETLWISTGEGLAEFDKKTKNIVWFTGQDTIKTPGNNILKTGDIKYITCQPDGKIWMATYPSGLFRLDPETKKLENFGVIGSTNFGEFYITKLLFYENQLYISTHNDGLFWFNPEEKKVHNEVFGNLGYFVHHFQLSNDSIAWLATNNGLIHYNFQTAKYQQFKTEPNDPLSIERTASNHVFVDKKNNLWLSSGIRGVNYGLTNVPFSHFSFSEDGAYQLTLKEVTAIQFDYEGNMWLGYEGGFVERHSNNPLTKKHFKLKAKNRTGIPGSTLAILQDSSNQIWMGGWESGLQRLNNAGTEFGFAPVLPDSTAHLIAAADVRGLAEDRHGNIWISFHGIGIGRYNPKPIF
jgi:ligand-binding sensor domain-containing protein